jgi:hypothetical protein
VQEARSASLVRFPSQWPCQIRKSRDFREKCCAASRQWRAIVTMATRALRQCRKGHKHKEAAVPTKAKPLALT